jgi:hypothetical protein
MKLHKVIIKKHLQTQNSVHAYGQKTPFCFSLCASVGLHRILGPIAYPVLLIFTGASQNPHQPLIFDDESDEEKMVILF